MKTTPHRDRLRVQNSATVRRAEANFHPRLPSRDRHWTVLLRKEEGPGFPRGRRSSPLRVLRPLRCGMDWFRRLDLRLAVGDSDGAPVEGGGDVRSCRPDCCGGSGEHAPNKRRNCCGTPNASHVTRYCADTHANGARRTDTVVERERSCLVAHDVSGVTAWRGFRTRYRRRSSWSSDGQACHADSVGVPLTRASRGRLTSGRRPLYEYRIEPAFAQARFSGSDRG
jgi:hypothetical protein